ncbi:MAG: hypothetical protein IT462_08720 [Planctomycetes bacterium]|nr:hypothetical protein [Planctomycetota bacterium]
MKYAWMLLFFAAAPLCAEDVKSTESAEQSWLKQFSISAEVDVVSKYIFRGWDVYDDRPAFQPSFTLNTPNVGLGFSVWGSWALSGREEHEASTKTLDEIDLTFFFRRRFWQLEFGVGHISYIYPNTDGHAGTTSELFTDVRFYVPALPAFVPVSVYGQLFYDYDKGNDYYLRFGADAGPNLTVAENITLTFPLQFWVGYNHGQLNVDSAIADVNFGAGVQVGWRCLWAKLVVNYTITPEDTINPHDDGEFWALFALGVSF